MPTFASIPGCTAGILPVCSSFRQSSRQVFCLYNEHHSPKVSREKRISHNLQRICFEFILFSLHKPIKRYTHSNTRSTLGSPRVGESCREATERGRFPVAPTIGRRHDKLIVIVHPGRIRAQLPLCHPERAQPGESKDLSLLSHIKSHFPPCDLPPLSSPRTGGSLHLPLALPASGRAVEK